MDLNAAENIFWFWFIYIASIPVVAIFLTGVCFVFMCVFAIFCQAFSK